MGEIGSVEQVLRGWNQDQGIPHRSLESLVEGEVRFLCRGEIYVRVEEKLSEYVSV